ncbi:hypothetical protein BKA65DRAFT_561577 [Rhexocercosporidium sp. MPI-PUGE-AT-0058]|nr:hypothetical protein BKA65DRAFT_561577 [Rhexocercosporidium sp. MPI-PUGE-AT-0058]
MESLPQRISKNEQKRRAKQQEKQERLSQQPARPAAQTPDSARELEILPHQYHENRLKLFQNIRSSPGHKLYPSGFEANITDLAAFKTQWESLATGEENASIRVNVRGRIIFIRSAGEHLRFYVIQNGEEQIQIVYQAKEGVEMEWYRQQHEHLGRGDIIGVVGHPGRTAPRGRPVGELSIFASQIILLAPSLWMIPKDTGFTDAEQRHRNRALDLIVNRKTRDMFRARHQMNLYITNFLSKRGYIGVETPILGQVAGGAAAKPFTTFHNDLKRNLFLRIATELPLKQLVVGGLDRVFEIGRVFRNEDIDLTHNPEFSSCEFYQADANYNDMMALTEEMVSGLVKEATGSYVTNFTTQAGEMHEVNWATPWRRIEMIPALEEATGARFPDSDQLHTEQTREFLVKLLEKHNVTCSPPQTNARMLDKLVGEFIESICINPTFIIHHPKMMSPLSKAHPLYPGLTERAEAFVCKREICNLFTELNDPYEQRERFLEQASQKDQGDDEAQLIDEDFCRALEYGLPPTGGCGLGLDRILMFLTNNYSIKEVLAYPMMRDEGGKAKPKQEVVAVNTVVDYGCLGDKQKRLLELRSQIEQLEGEIAGLTVQ